ncbi:MAG: polyprenol monophosphomannose synthase [Acidimicrobiia bacterium]
MRVQICTPTYIEAENIEEFLRRARAAVPSADILVLDDNSPDGTADIAERVGVELGQIDVLRRPEKRGLGAAYRAGFAIGIARGYDVICQVDADLSHDPEVLPDLIAAVAADADLAIGSRYVRGGAIPHWPKRRLALSKYGNKYARFMLRTGVRDTSAGFRAYRADLLKAIDFSQTRAKGYGFQLETTYRAARVGARIVELPITFTDRVRGYSKMSGSVIVEEMALMTWWGLRDRLRRKRSAA